MYLCAIALLSLALTTITVTALPNHIAAKNRLVRREKQMSTDIGNLKLTFSNETITITETTTDAIIEKIAEACFIEGQCKTPPISFHNIDIHPSGNYPTWIRNGLIDALRAGVKTVSSCTEETNWRELYCADDLYAKCESEFAVELG